MKHLFLPLASLALAAGTGSLVPAAAYAQENSTALQELRDRAAIYQLLLDYGRTIDERDFDAFGALFTADGEYGGSSSMAVGREAIAAQMRTTFESNALGFGEPNFHVFFNQSISLVAADRATASSMSLYIVPGEEGAPRIALMARYEDDIVRVGDEWKFRRRQVFGLMPRAVASAANTSD